MSTLQKTLSNYVNISNGLPNEPINVHHLPTEGSSIVTTLREGDTIFYTHPPFNGWLPVHTSGQDGYVRLIYTNYYA